MVRGQKQKSKGAKRVTASPQQYLDAFQARVEELLDNDSGDRFTLGLFWRELVREHYVEKTKNPDLPTPDAWWHEKLGGRCDVRTARRLGRITKRFDPPALKTFGEVFLDDLLTWAERYKIVLPKDPSAVPVHFTTPDGKTVTKAVGQMSPTEMEWALKKPKGDRAPRSGGDDDGKADHTPLQWKWLGAAQEAIGPSVTGAVGDSEDGVWVWDLMTIYPQDTRRVLSALLAAYEKFAKENHELK